MFVIKNFAFLLKLNTYILGEIWNNVRVQWEDSLRKEGVKVVAWSLSGKSLLIFKARHNPGFFFCFFPSEGHCVSILGCVSSDSPFFQHWLLTSPDTISQPISAENWQAQLQQQNGKFKRKYTRDRHRMLLVWKSSCFLSYLCKGQECKHFFLLLTTTCVYFELTKPFSLSVFLWISFFKFEL